MGMGRGAAGVTIATKSLPCGYYTREAWGGSAYKGLRGESSEGGIYELYCLTAVIFGLRSSYIRHAASYIAEQL